MNAELIEMAEHTIQAFRASNRMIATAESCTGGLISACLTAVAGSSEAFERGFVTYSNEAKQELLGVDPETIDNHGAVSPETALAMAMGALANANANAAVAVTGIAGPGGGSSEKPVGLVYIAVASDLEEGAFVEECRFGDIGRETVRQATVSTALEMLLAYGLEEG